MQEDWGNLHGETGFELVLEGWTELWLVEFEQRTTFKSPSKDIYEISFKRIRINKGLELIN